MEALEAIDNERAIVAQLQGKVIPMTFGFYCSNIDGGSLWATLMQDGGNSVDLEKLRFPLR